MTTERAPLLGWGAFLAAGVGAAMLGAGGQLVFAGLVIGLLGLPHGASDLAIVPHTRRRSFLAAYLLCIAAVIALWRVAPMIGLTTLLILSALHFALDGKARHASIEDWAIGGFLVGGPALFHRAAIAALFRQATDLADASAILAHGLHDVGLIATATLLQRLTADARPAPERVLRLLAMAATLALPPLVGFAIGFVLLHARGQTVERQRAIGCPTMAAYLVRVAPLMAGAAGVLLLVAIGIAGGRMTDTTLLFAGIAALATPHMLVTPLWQRETAVGSYRGAALGR